MHKFCTYYVMQTEKGNSYVIILYLVRSNFSVLSPHDLFSLHCSKLTFKIVFHPLLSINIYVIKSVHAILQYIYIDFSSCCFILFQLGGYQYNLQPIETFGIEYHAYQKSLLTYYTTNCTFIYRMY